ncbi:hypothetical protein LCGC14_1375630 [marine sediment metagenome]|uniref:Uncharacterized protein n=1 Tax=marine sediment metagenome TaxID=412755 RepID=A0A0F9MJE9_9ZZZZ
MTRTFVPNIILWKTVIRAVDPYWSVQNLETGDDWPDYKWCISKKEARIVADFANWLEARYNHIEKLRSQMKVTKIQLKKMVDAVLDYREMKRGSKYLPHVRRKQETLARQTILIALGTLPTKYKNTSEALTDILQKI